MTKPKIDWSKPQEVSNLCLAFPAHVINKLLPESNEIPDEFWSMSNEWSRFAQHLFALSLNHENYDGGLKEGLDPDLVDGISTQF